MAGGDSEAGKSRSRRRAARPVLVLVVIAAAVAGVTLAVRSGGDPAPVPDPFYNAPDPLPRGRPGTILRSRKIADPPAGTLGWKLLYLSRSHTGKPAALSAVLLVSNRAPASNGRNVVVYAHPVLGLERRCAPSLDPASWKDIPGLKRFMRAGDAVVVPDYEGLGTAGTHPLFVGAAQGRATLDAVRATSFFEPASASTRFVAWGVSQGGHTALFAGQEAERYAPELEIAGIAAAAPTTDLERLVLVNRETVPGRILAAYLFSAWARVYPEVQLEQILTPEGRQAAERLSKLCVPADSGTIDANAAKLAADVSFAERRPFAGTPLRRLLSRDSPGAGSTAAPILITQGTRDQLVRPELTRRFVRRLCSRDWRVQYRVSRRVAHRDVAEKTAPYVANWAADRFAGRAARNTC